MKTLKLCDELGNDEVSIEVGNYQNNNCLYIGLIDVYINLTRKNLESFARRE